MIMMISRAPPVGSADDDGLNSNAMICWKHPSSFLLCPLPLEFCEFSDVELAVAILVERPEDGVHVVLGQL